MIINIEKLYHLWMNKKSTFKGNKTFCDRIDQIYTIVEGWENDKENIESIKLPRTPEEEDIPFNNWSTVKQNFLKVYEADDQLKAYVNQIDQVEHLLHIAAEGKDSQFRTSSNAACDSQYETNNTEKSRLNPESWIASHNYPFEIIQFYLACAGQDNSLQFPVLRNCAEQKFVRKFLWMLANREKVVPILSLKSFYGLSPLFSDIKSDVDWGGKYHWELDLKGFVSCWSVVSDTLSQQITGNSLAGLNSEDRKDFAKLLFIASLNESTTKNAFDMLMTGNKAIILYGPPGTGKTYQAQEVVKQLLGANDQNIFDACNFDKRFPKPSSESGESTDYELSASSLPGCWAIIQFHPTYSYHDFIGGIMPALTGNTLGYVMKEGIFKRFCDAAAKMENKDKPFVLIIDEINRADLSSVFGELMYALEYRNKEVNILHFGSFVIPDNVYVIGTMNSTDKSLVTFDLALRRRFLFFKLMPDMNVLNLWNSQQETPIDNENLTKLIERAEKLNKAVVGKDAQDLNLPEDYGIGQAYFMKIRDFCVEENVRMADETENYETQLYITEFAREQLWIYHLEPLLEEYLGSEVDAKKKELQNLRHAFVNDTKQ